MESIIKIKSDGIHQSIFEIDEGTEIRFPLERIKTFLISNGFVYKEYESSDEVKVFSRNGKKAIVCPTAISIQELHLGEKEKFNQVFNSYIISRSKIFFESALQNQKASKINLIQNQRRTCVSNMYYSIHNSFAGFIESYREKRQDDDINNTFFRSEDEEGMLGHFTPSALESFVQVIQDIENMTLVDILGDTRLSFARFSSHQNPYSWLLLLKEYVDNETLQKIVNDIRVIVESANMTNYGADDSQRRTNSENQLKNSVSNLSTYFDNPSKEISTFSILACFLGNSYILRQSGDYDSLFEVKVEQKDIIYWTIASSNLIDFIMHESGYLSKENKSRIQQLDAISSQSTLIESLNGRTGSIMTQTGIIIDSSFNFIDYGKYLYLNKGYYPVNANGRYEHFNIDRPFLTLQKKLVGTSLMTVLTISKEGLLRVDIFDDHKRQHMITRNVNPYYLEKMIEREVFSELLEVNNKVNIVSGIPHFKAEKNPSYFQIVSGISEVNRRRLFDYFRNIDRYIDLKEYEDVNFIVDYTTSLKFLPPRYRSSYGFRRNGEDSSISKPEVLVIFTIESEIEDFEKTVATTKQKIQNISEQDIIVEVVGLTDSETKKLYNREFSTIRFHLNEIYNKLIEPSTMVVDDFEKEDDIVEEEGLESEYTEDEINDSAEVIERHFAIS